MKTRERNLESLLQQSVEDHSPLSDIGGFKSSICLGQAVCLCIAVPAITFSQGVLKIK